MYRTVPTEESIFKIKSAASIYIHYMFDPFPISLPKPQLERPFGIECKVK
jgi:hypothetical protein